MRILGKKLWMHGGHFELLTGLILPFSKKRFSPLPWPGSYTRYIKGRLLSLDVWFSAQTRRKRQKEYCFKTFMNAWKILRTRYWFWEIFFLFINFTKSLNFHDVKISSTKFSNFSDKFLVTKRLSGVSKVLDLLMPEKLHIKW